MTRSEWDAAMQRYMHRNDLTQDLDLTFTLSTQKIFDRLLRTDTDTDAILDVAPALYVHAGLMVLMEVSQDDVGLVREGQLFENSAVNYAMKYSIDTVDPTMIVGS